jgi:hypothetical protein
MAGKSKAEPGDRSNRVRFVMLEADLSDTNVNALAQAIVSALKPDTPAAPKRLPPVAPTATVRLPTPPAPSNGDLEFEATDVDAADESPATEEEPAATSPTTTRTRKPSKPTQPKYVNDLFSSTTEADAFKAFVAQHPTDKDSERYLVAALYLRDHRHPVVNMHKVYTCYRTSGWSMAGLNDWDVNLRNQVRNDRFRRVEGGYSLTTNGESIVQGLRTP